MISSKKLVNIFFNFIIGSLGKNVRNRRYLLKSMCVACEKYYDEFLSFNCRPKCSDKLITNNEFGEKLDTKCAIILQGPILEKDDFTVETVKLYKNMYPEQLIIVSTWKDADKNIVKDLQNLNAVVVLNEPPETTGLGNVNYQVISTLGGIKKAKELNCDYILKTRTDQRICIPDFLNYFLSLLNLYPSKGHDIEKRLIMVSGVVGGIMLVPYMMSDFLFFSSTENIEKLFGLELDPLNMKRSEREEFIDGLINNSTVYDFYKKTAPESRIIERFIDKYTVINADGSIKSYWEFIKDYAITLSMRDIDLFWHKYDFYEESELTKVYPRYDNEDKCYRYIWNLANWIMLYCGKIKYKPEFEVYKERVKSEN